MDKITELKAQAFDVIATIHSLQEQIQQYQQMLGQINQQITAAQAEAAIEAEKPEKTKEAKA